MKNTTNYSLLLPEENDSYNVDDMNANTEIIDAQMKSNQTKVDAVTLNYNAHALWYMILAAIMAGLIVAFVSMYGWEKLYELWKRFNNKKE